MKRSSFETQNLAVHGTDGYDMYRVPGLVTAGNGDLLAYYEGRAKNPDDRVLLLRRSRDGGRTFAAQEVLRAGREGKMVHNPLMLAGEGHTLFLFWNEDYRRCYARKSCDDGESWGPEQDLTGAVEKFRPAYPWNLFAVAPGHGLRMRNGTLVVPLWMSRGVNAHKPACFAVIYSDDGGETWKAGGRVDSTETVCDPTEASVAECRDGSLLATMRHGTRLSRRRAFARGTCEKWRPAFQEESLPDPVCAASLLGLPDGRMLFSNCAYGDEPALERIRAGEEVQWSRDARRNLTVRISEDDGATWSTGILLAEKGGYSDLALSSDGKTVFCFYERGWIGGNCIFNQNLSLTAFPLSSVVSEQEEKNI